MLSLTNRTNIITRSIFLFSTRFLFRRCKINFLSFLSEITFLSRLVGCYLMDILSCITITPLSRPPDPIIVFFPAYIFQSMRNRIYQQIMNKPRRGTISNFPPFPEPPSTLALFSILKIVKFSAFFILFFWGGALKKIPLYNILTWVGGTGGRLRPFSSFISNDFS